NLLGLAASRSPYTQDEDDRQLKTSAIRSQATDRLAPCSYRGGPVTTAQPMRALRPKTRLITSVGLFCERSQVDHAYLVGGAKRRVYPDRLHQGGGADRGLGGRVDAGGRSGSSRR